MSEDQQPEGDDPVFLEMGLRAFPGFGEDEDGRCPKCRFPHMRVDYHPTILMNMDENELWPCAVWVQSGLLTPTVTEHLCLKCSRCGYGYPVQTADA